MGNVIENISQYMKGKTNDVKPENETCKQLYVRLSASYPVGERAFQVRFKNLTGRNYATNRICTREEVTKMEAAYKPDKDKLKRVITAGKAPVSNEVSGPPLKRVVRKVDWDIAIVRIILAGGVIGHAALILYECAYLWNNAGLIAGSVVFALIVSAVILIRKNAGLKSAQNILWAVLLLDFFAIPVHEKSLYHAGSNAFGAGISEYGTACLAVVISGCAGALIYFYREIGLKK